MENYNLVGVILKTFPLINILIVMILIIYIVCDDLFVNITACLKG